MAITFITRASVVALARSILREKTTDSFDTLADLNPFFRQAYREWAMELLWPEMSWFGATAAGLGPSFLPGTAQEYQLPENLNRIYRVYLNGNRCVPSTIALLEGDVRQIFDAVWRIFPTNDPVNFTQPLPSSKGGSIPITAGPLPVAIKYYLRGGWVGFFPAPQSVGLPIQIDGVAIPNEPRDDLEPLVFPPHLEDGLAWRTAEISAISDDRVQLAKTLHDVAEEQLKQARRWRRNLQGDMTMTVSTYDYRGYWGNVGPLRSFKSIR